MKIKTAIRSLKVEKGCVNIDCNYCVENKKCYLQQLIEENEKLKKTIEKIKALNLFSLNNSREKIAEINAIINDQKESEERC